VASIDEAIRAPTLGLEGMKYQGWGGLSAPDHWERGAPFPKLGSN